MRVKVEREELQESKVTVIIVWDSDDIGEQKAPRCVPWPRNIAKVLDHIIQYTQYKHCGKCPLIHFHQNLSDFWEKKSPVANSPSPNTYSRRPP